MSTIHSKVVLGARVFLGLIFVVFGLNGFLGFLPAPPLPQEAGAFIGALVESGYLMKLVKLTEVVAGLGLLLGLFVPLALTVLAPIVINIVLFHLLLTPPNPVAFLVLGLEIYLAWAYREAFAGVLAMHARPHTDAATRPLGSSTTHR